MEENRIGPVVDPSVKTSCYFLLFFFCVYRDNNTNRKVKIVYFKPVLEELKNNICGKTFPNSLAQIVKGRFKVKKNVINVIVYFI